MSEIKIHIFHIGKVCVAPELPFGGEHYSALKASGVLDRKSKRLWLPVSAYLIECAHGNVLFDCGWHRDMSPHGVFERRAQIRSLGSLPLYFTNQVVVESSAAIDEQLAARGVAPVDWDAVLLSHLDCDHANGLKLVADAKKILVLKDELRFAENGSPVNRIRYNANWWRGTKMQTFDWNGLMGSAGRSYDVFGDGMLVMVNIPGHSKGLCALRITGEDGRLRRRRLREALMETGIDYKAANKLHFRTKSKKRLALEGELLRTMEFYDEDRVVIVAVPQSLQKSMALSEADMEDLASLGGLVEGTDCAVTMKETKDGAWKVSVRTGARVNATRACSFLGGGGHRAASGCLIEHADYETARAMILNAIAEAVAEEA